MTFAITGITVINAADNSVIQDASGIGNLTIEDTVSFELVGNGGVTLSDTDNAKLSYDRETGVYTLSEISGNVTVTIA